MDEQSLRVASIHEEDTPRAFVCSDGLRSFTRTVGSVNPLRLIPGNRLLLRTVSSPCSGKDGLLLHGAPRHSLAGWFQGMFCTGIGRLNTQRIG